MDSLFPPIEIGINLSNEIPQFNISLPIEGFEPVWRLYGEIFKIIGSFHQSESFTDRVALISTLRSKMIYMGRYLLKLPISWRKEIKKIAEWAGNEFFSIKKRILLEKRGLLPIVHFNKSDDVEKEDSYFVAEEIPCPFNDPVKGPVYFLTGRVQKIPLENISEALRRNLDLGKEIIRYTQEHIPYSQNHLRRVLFSSIKILDQNPEIEKQLKGIEKIADSILDKIREDDEERGNLDAFSEDLHFCELVKSGGVGNCDEMSLFGLLYAQNEKNVDALIKLASIELGDHQFLIIDPPLKSPFCWEDSVICDPWSGSCFPAIKVNEHLRGYTGFAENLYPIVFPVRAESIRFIDYFYPNSTFDLGYLKKGDLSKVEEILKKTPKYTENIRIYIEFVHTSLDADQWSVVAFLLEKGKRSCLPKFLGEEILIGIVEAYTKNLADLPLVLKILSKIESLKIAPSKYEEASQFLIQNAQDLDFSKVIEILNPRHILP
jgi:hypothetical protein